MLTIWHNPRCRKSRETLALLQNAGQVITIRLYLEDTPSEPEIREILKQLDFDDPRSLIRRGESTYKELGLKTVTDPAILVKSMSKTPILIERPVVTDGHKAIVGRPPEAVKALF